MSSFKLFGAALVIAAFVAVPASAQQAVSEPGAFAFYHPDVDVLSAGGPAPSGSFAAMRSGDVGTTQMVVRSHKAMKRH